MQRAVKVKTLCNVPVFAGAFFCRRQEKRSTKGLRAKAFRAGKGIVCGFCGVSVRVLFTAARQKDKGSLRQSYFSVQPRALCFTQHVWHLHVANAAVRRFERAFGATAQGAFCKCGRGAVFRSRFFCRVRAGFRSFGGRFFSKASAPHGACRQTRKAFFRGRSGRFLRRRKKLGDFHSNLCLCAQKSLKFFEICLNFFQITIEKYLSVC